MDKQSRDVLLHLLTSVVFRGNKQGNRPKIWIKGASMLPQKLSESSISKVIPKDKTYKLFDGGGLYLLVTPKGGRFWRVKYRYAGKEGTLSFGAYPEVSLGEARIKHEAARHLLRQGINPSLARQLDNLSIRDEAARQKSDAKAAAKGGRLKVAVLRLP